MRRMSGYPRWFYKVLMLAFLVLLGSGVLLLPHLFSLRLEWEIGWEIASSTRLFSVALHSTFGFLVMAAVGALFSIHMRAGWRRRANIFSGMLLLSLFALMWLSAIGIYYFGDEQFSRWSSIVHVLAAASALLVFVWHHIVGERFRHARERH